MASFDLVSFAAVLLAVGGLAAVLCEILVKSPGSLVEMASDSRRFAEVPLMGEAVPAALAVHQPAKKAEPAANLNHPRLAA